ncbi:MAG TPA: hypothetical protein VH186_37565 [Chloroflexia bacterium]|nr:hypothetical protein [Chloroflexia bacterium]
MSYYPPPSRGSEESRANYAPDRRYVPPARGTRRSARPASRPGAGAGCAAYMLGFLTATVIAVAVVFFLYFYNGNSAAGPLARPAPQSGTSDINTTLSQTFLNRVIQQQLSASPVKAGMVDISDMVLRVQANNQIDIDLKAVTGPVNFNVTVTEQLSVSGGHIRLEAVGQPRLLGGQLPPGINTIINVVNTAFIEPSLNQQVTQILVNKRPIQLTGISTTPGFLIVQANVP